MGARHDWASNPVLTWLSTSKGLPSIERYVVESLSLNQKQNEPLLGLSRVISVISQSHRHTVIVRRVSIASELSSLSFNSVRAEWSFAIRYPNVVIKSSSGNLVICLSNHASAYFQSRNSVRDFGRSQRFFLKSPFWVTILSWNCDQRQLQSQKTLIIWMHPILHYYKRVSTYNWLPQLLFMTNLWSITKRCLYPFITSTAHFISQQLRSFGSWSRKKGLPSLLGTLDTSRKSPYVWFQKTLTQ